MTIFLDADDRHWIVARNRQELYEALLEHIDPVNDSDLTRLAAACLDCEIDAVAWLETP